MKNIIVNTSANGMDHVTQGDFWKTTATNGAGLVADIFKNPDKLMATFAHVTAVKFEDEPALGGGGGGAIPWKAWEASYEYRSSVGAETKTEPVASQVQSLEDECRIIGLPTWRLTALHEGNPVVNVYTRESCASGNMLHVATIVVKPDDEFNITENATAAGSVLRTHYTDFTKLVVDLLDAAQAIKDAGNTE